MISFLKKITGLGNKVDYAQLMKQGAIVLDVRSKGEFSGGHIKGSMNIPVDSLASQLSKLKNKETPIITCCASGMRSGMAKRILLSNGYKQVHNGGSWASLKNKL